MAETELCTNCCAGVKRAFATKLSAWQLRRSCCCQLKIGKGPRIWCTECDGHMVLKLLHHHGDVKLAVDMRPKCKELETEGKCPGSGRGWEAAEARTVNSTLRRASDAKEKRHQCRTWGGTHVHWQRTPMTTEKGCIKLIPTTRNSSILRILFHHIHSSWKTLWFGRLSPGLQDQPGHRPHLEKDYCDHHTDNTEEQKLQLCWLRTLGSKVQAETTTTKLGKGESWK